MEGQRSEAGDETKVADVVQEYWNEKGARVYDKIHYIDRVKLKDTLLKHLDRDKNGTILDFGTGTGFLAAILAEAGYQRLLCLDINRHMLKRAEKRLAGYPALLVRGDGLHLPLEDNSVDAVVSKWVLWVLPDPEQAIKEMVRVTKPGGKIVALDSGRHEHKEKRLLLKRLLKRLHSFYIAASTGASPNRSQIFWQETKGKLPMYSLDKYMEISQQQGLEVIVDKEEEYGTALGSLFYDGFKFYLIEGTKAAVPGKESAVTLEVINQEERNLFDILVCPECRGSLKINGQDRLACEGCQKTYAILEGIPDLLPAEDKLL